MGRINKNLKLICVVKSTSIGTCQLSVEPLRVTSLKRRGVTRLRKIKENSPTPWYNEHTPALKKQQEENKTTGILNCMAGKYLLLQKSIKNCWI